MNAEEYMTMLTDIENKIRTRIEEESVNYENCFTSRDAFEKRKELIIQYFMGEAKAEVDKQAIEAMRAQRNELLEQYEFNEAEIAEFEHNISTGVKDYIQYINDIQKPLEKNLSQYNARIRRTLTTRLDNAIETVEDLVKRLKAAPIQMAEMKASVEQTIAEDEKEIEMLEAKICEFSLEEEAAQEKINAFDEAFKNELKVIEATKQALEEAKNNKLKCQQLELKVEEMAADLEECKQEMHEIEVKYDERMDINAEITKKISELENLRESIRQDCDNEKKANLAMDKKLKFMKSKSGGKLKFADMEADPNYKDAIDSAEYHEHRQIIRKFMDDGVEIAADLEKTHADNVTAAADLSKDINELKDLQAKSLEQEANIAEAVNKEQEALRAYEALKAEIENNEKKDREAIENLKTMLLNKAEQKETLENHQEQLIALKKTVEDAIEKRRKNFEEEELKRKQPRRSRDLQKSSQSQPSSATTSRAEEKAKVSQENTFDALKHQETSSEINYVIKRPAYMMGQRDFDFPDIDLTGEHHREEDEKETEDENENENESESVNVEDESSFENESFTLDTSAFDTDDDLDIELE